MLRLGIVDFDSSHSIEFTRRFNHVGVDRDQCVDGARVEVGCPGSSNMAPQRIAEYAKQAAACGVELVDAPERLLGRIDAALVLSLCGQAHLDRAAMFLKAGIPTFVDKPFACSVSDAEGMVQLARAHSTLLFSSSALPFAEEIECFSQRLRDTGDVQGVVSYGPAKRADGNPGLFHYGIHAVSILCGLMGPGCESVANAWTEDAENVTAWWRDGRTATLRGIRRGATSYGVLAFCENSVVHQPVSTRYAYRNLCRKIVESFTSGRPAVSHETTLEIVRFVVTAQESERRGGKRIRLDSVK